jgi:hydroxyethylthiazole kinase-like uncharacterized protein yjeF
MPIQRITASEEDLPLFANAGTRAIEERASAALPGHTLMQSAGAAVARLALALAPHARHVRVLAGPGNNGGDGFEAAVHLQGHGRSVEVVLVGDAARLPADAAAALVRARNAGVAVGPIVATSLAAHDIAIDALLGIGAGRAPEGTLAQAISSLGALPCPVLAVDLPSGLDAATGRPFGDVCVRAQHTLALLTLKPGLFTAAGRDHAGSVWFDALDVDSAGEKPSAWLAGAAHAVPDMRRHEQHKGSFGDVAVVAGAAGMTGAALLAARAAHAAGAGRVFVQLLDGGSRTLDGGRPELMFRPHWSDSTPDVLGASTVVCGCGGGAAVRAVLPRLLSLVPRLVLDADALNVLGADESLRALLRARAARGFATVLTPHPLEAARLLGTSAREVQADRLSAACRLADVHACVVLLKGSGSIVAAPGQTPWINPTGNAALATAGTGDVLAGWLAGLWSQRPQAGAAARNALAAAWLHGHAADCNNARVLRAADLVEEMAIRQAPGRSAAAAAP